MQNSTHRWQLIRQKVNEIAKLDSQNVVFGSDYHEYIFNDIVDTTIITHFETQFGIEFPESLKAYYRVMGNGGISPSYSFSPIESLEAFQPSKDYPGIEYYKELARTNGDMSDDGYFEGDFDDLSGLIQLFHMGCGMYACIVASGNQFGEVVVISDCYFIEETGLSLDDYYENWCNDQIAIFSSIEELLMSDLNMKQIDQKLNADHQCHNGNDLVMSYIGVKRPKRLFGTRSHRKYHGATQFPWYEKQLQKYRSRKKWWSIF